MRKSIVRTMLKSFPFLCLLLVATIQVRSDPAYVPIPEPPANAALGPRVNGCALGLWTEKSAYTRKEKKNVWVILEAKYVPDGFYDQSRLEVRSGEKMVLNFQIGEPTDGIPHSGFEGGLYGELAGLQPGTYSMTWRTATNVSNRISFTVTP